MRCGLALSLLGLALLAGCAGYCPTDHSGVERSPWSGRGPDTHRTPMH